MPTSGWEGAIREAFTAAERRSAGSEAEMRTPQMTGLAVSWHPPCHGDTELSVGRASGDERQHEGDAPLRDLPRGKRACAMSLGSLHPWWKRVETGGLERDFFGNNLIFIYLFFILLQVPITSPQRIDSVISDHGPGEGDFKARTCRL